MTPPTIKRKPLLTAGWEKRLADFLKSEGLTCPAFTGKLDVEIYQGGVAKVDRKESLK